MEIQARLDCIPTTAVELQHFRPTGGISNAFKIRFCSYTVAIEAVVVLFLCYWTPPFAVVIEMAIQLLDGLRIASLAILTFHLQRRVDRRYQFTP